MTAIAIALVLVVLALCAVIAFLVKTHREETKDLHLRLASRSLEDYHYWRDAHPLEVEHNKERLEAVRRDLDAKAVKEAELTPEERANREKAKGF